MSYTVEPIGVVRSPYLERYGTPRQATVTEGVLGDGPAEARIELDPARVPVEALRDLEGFSHIWIIAWLDRNQGWRATVKPPRGPRVARGVFATRSPHRPNPIGLSAVRLVGIEGHTLRLLGVDLLDGTPVIDVKPYVPYADAFPDAAIGWLAEVEGALDGPDRATRAPSKKR